MSYNALIKIKEINNQLYEIENSVSIPNLPSTLREYGKNSLLFIRDCAEDLKFDPSSKRAALQDCDGRSSGLNKIPFNMERDLDRLSFEAAIGRFLSSGSREDAFDIYYCYCEIFKPFGSGYDTTGLLLEMLSEHETNASSLLMKHRDHYSHSVYVFLIGLSMYKKCEKFRISYLKKYGFEDNSEAACHFLEYWGLTSLFHDIGYPFEIAHQQMKAYVCQLDKDNNDSNGFSPYVSYKNMDLFTSSSLGNLNNLYAKIISERLGIYIDRVGANKESFENELKDILYDRAIHENPKDMDYLYMDHAYFSGLMMAKTYLNRHDEFEKYSEVEPAVFDAFCAIILHNSLFKFTIRSVLKTKEPMSLCDNQPLSYLLMLCDELQCSDRTAYGQNSRTGIFAFDFDLKIDENGNMCFEYFFDKTYEEKVINAKSYKDMLFDGYTKKSGAVRDKRSKFIDDIDEIIKFSDVAPNFEPNVEKPDFGSIIKAYIEPKQKKTGLYLSDSNYISLYEFALALNGRYCGAETEEDMKKAFEENLSLEYKLSNIAQAKAFAGHLNKINCFYTDRPVDFEPLLKFTREELSIIAKDEHKRWCDEKESLGWQYGSNKDGVIRERTRLHYDLIPFEELPNAEVLKDSAPMEKMVELIQQFGGLMIYRMKK